MTWRWIGAIVGIALCHVDFGFNLLGPGLHGVAEVVKDNVKILGWILIGACARKEMASGLIRIGAAALTALLLAAVIRHRPGFAQPIDQIIWLALFACALAALSAWIPPRARKGAYGILLAFAWVATGTVLFDGIRLGAGWSTIGGLIAAGILAGFTAVYRAWSRTGRPPQWFFDRLKIESNDARFYFEEPLNEQIGGRVATLDTKSAIEPETVRAKSRS